MWDTFDIAEKGFANQLMYLPIIAHGTPGVQGIRVVRCCEETSLLHLCYYPEKTVDTDSQYKHATLLRPTVFKPSIRDFGNLTEALQYRGSTSSSLKALL